MLFVEVLVAVSQTDHKLAAITVLGPFVGAGVLVFGVLLDHGHDTLVAVREPGALIVEQAVLAVYFILVSLV